MVVSNAVRNVLIVEDDDLIRSSLVGLLEDEGYRPTACCDGLDALEHLRAAPPEERPGLIILDLMLPVMSGWEFRVEQKKDPALAGIPILALSADSSPKAAAIDADAYLSKPFDLTALLNTVELLLLRAEREAARREESVRDRMAALGTIAAGVAHEINNPLAFVMMNLGLAGEEAQRLRGVLTERDQLRSVDEILRSIDEALQGTSRIRNIVAEVKAFSRADDRQVTALDVRRLLDSAARIAGSEIRHRAELVTDYDAVPEVRANEGRLCQVFLNLLVNAAQAIPQGTGRQHRIRVATRAEEGRALIEIEDSGAGIPPEQLRKIFDPFFTTKPVGEGMGLGLTICHRVIEDLGGEIRVESRVGQGTKFSVLLPAAAATERPAPPPSLPPEAAPARRARVLVIDDEPAIGRSVERILQPSNDVTSVPGGADALDRIHAGERWDVLLCDLQMPGMSGMELHEALGRECPEQAERMIFMTGGAIAPAAKSFVAGLTAPVVEKPFTAADLRERVRRMLG